MAAGLLRITKGRRMHTLTLRARLIAAGCAAAALWGIGAGAWAISQSLAPLIFFGYLGTIIAPGILYLDC